MTEVRFSKNGAATVSATIIVDDDNEHIAPLSLFLTATAVANVAVSLTINSQSGPVGSKYTVRNFGIGGGLGGVNLPCRHRMVLRSWKTTTAGWYIN